MSTRTKWIVGGVAFALVAWWYLRKRASATPPPFGPGANSGPVPFGPLPMETPNNSAFV